MAHADLFPGQWQPQVVLMAALKVGRIEALLEAPLQPEVVAEKLALDERATLRVVRVLIDAGYLEERSDGVMVAPEVRGFLDAGDEAFIGDRLLHLHGLLVRWAQLPQVLHDGEPVDVGRDRRPSPRMDVVRAVRGGVRPLRAQTRRGGQGHDSSPRPPAPCSKRLRRLPVFDG